MIWCNRAVHEELIVADLVENMSTILWHQEGSLQHSHRSGVVFCESDLTIVLEVIKLPTAQHFYLGLGWLSWYSSSLQDGQCRDLIQVGWGGGGGGQDFMCLSRLALGPTHAIVQRVPALFPSLKFQPVYCGTVKEHKPCPWWKMCFKSYINVWILWPQLYALYYGCPVHIQSGLVVPTVATLVKTAK